MSYITALIIFLCLFLWGLFSAWQASGDDFSASCRAAGGVPVLTSHNGWHCYSDKTHIDVEKTK